MYHELRCEKRYQSACSERLNSTNISHIPRLTSYTNTTHSELRCEKLYQSVCSEQRLCHVNFTHSELRCMKMNQSVCFGAKTAPTSIAHLSEWRCEKVLQSIRWSTDFSNINLTHSELRCMKMCQSACLGAKAIPTSISHVNCAV